MRYASNVRHWSRLNSRRLWVAGLGVESGTEWVGWRGAERAELPVIALSVVDK